MKCPMCGNEMSGQQYIYHERWNCSDCELVVYRRVKHDRNRL